jgi:dTMP kinase
LITLEGIEGSGKSTQAKRLATFLRTLGYTTIETREPGGTPVAEKIRAVMLDPTTEPIAPETEAFLVFAARRQHVSQVIEPALRRGHIVLCDRFNDSTLAYQGYARGLDIELLREMNQLATEGIEPDLTILFDVPVETGLARRRALVTNRLDRETVRFHQKVRAGFRSLARQEPGRIALINGSRNEETVAHDVSQTTETLLQRSARSGLRPSGKARAAGRMDHAVR